MFFCLVSCAHVKIANYESDISYTQDSHALVRHYFLNRIEGYDNFYGEKSIGRPYGFWEMDRVWEDSAGELKQVLEATIASFLKLHLKYGPYCDSIDDYYFKYTLAKMPDPVTGLKVWPDKFKIDLIGMDQNGNKARYKVRFDFRPNAKGLKFHRWADEIQIVDVVKENGRWKLANVGNLEDNQSTINRLKKLDELFRSSYQWAEAHRSELFIATGNPQRIKRLHKEYQLLFKNIQKRMRKKAVGSEV